MMCVPEYVTEVCKHIWPVWSQSGISTCIYSKGDQEVNLEMVLEAIKLDRAWMPLAFIHPYPFMDQTANLSIPISDTESVWL